MIYAYLGIVDIMHFIEYHELDISYQISPFVEHASQNFRRHN